MLPGYNHNICYKGQVFHIQTEDSGVDHPHVITLLFVKGNIIARKKRDYQDILSFDRLDDAVRELMQDQHKDMLRELKGGKYDNYLVGGPTKDDQAVCAVEPSPAPPSAPPIGARVPSPVQPSAQPPAQPAAPPSAPPQAPPIGARVPSPAQPPAPYGVKPPAPAPRPPAGTRVPSPAPIGARVPSPAQSTAPPTAPPLAPRAAQPPAPPAARPPAPPPARPAAPPPAPEPEIQEKPASKTITISDEMDLKDEDIFGADMISDRSLDEVILSFLSKQMDEDEE